MTTIHLMAPGDHAVDAVEAAVHAAYRLGAILLVGQQFNVADRLRERYYSKRRARGLGLGDPGSLVMVDYERNQFLQRAYLTELDRETKRGIRRIRTAVDLIRKFRPARPVAVYGLPLVRRDGSLPWHKQWADHTLMLHSWMGNPEVFVTPAYIKGTLRENITAMAESVGLLQHGLKYTVRIIPAIQPIHGYSQSVHEDLRGKQFSEKYREMLAKALVKNKLDDEFVIWCDCRTEVKAEAAAEGIGKFAEALQRARSES